MRRRNITTAYFNPRSPCGERQRRDICIKQAKVFQSTLPVRGATTINSANLAANMEFQSTLPVRGATRQQLLHDMPQRISIHAPRAGSDASACTDGGGRAISIHAPRAGSDVFNSNTTRREHQFQSTLPVRGATLYFPCACRVWFQFQSTLPVRGATRDICPDFDK